MSDLRRSRAPLDIAMPLSLSRRQIDDYTGRLESAVAKEWARINVPDGGLNRGIVPVLFLCPQGEDGKPERQSVAAVNSTVQWLFGTSVGRNYAERMLKLAGDIEA